MSVIRFAISPPLQDSATERVSPEQIRYLFISSHQNLDMTIRQSQA